uniref:Uncharacterized protein n=1 Tax=Meloidogyne enterolobii TaxID=390850 RepID=A0A6V7UZB5_MELEN|nr:unnamed protein product [Meloidogyne enterolobii]
MDRNQLQKQKDIQIWYSKNNAINCKRLGVFLKLALAKVQKEETRKRREVTTFKDDDFIIQKDSPIKKRVRREHQDWLDEFFTKYPNYWDAIKDYEQDLKKHKSSVEEKTKQVMNENNTEQKSVFESQLQHLNTITEEKTRKFNLLTNEAKKRDDLDRQANQSILIGQIFYALELTRKYVTKELGSRLKFSRYHLGRFHKQKSDVMKLMQDIGIPLNKEKYDAQTYVPMVVDYWNKYYINNGYRFKVFIFGNKAETTPKYKYGSETFNTAIPICHSEDHFDGIRTVGAQFGPHWQYCYSCEKKYWKANEHANNCKSRCRLCGRVGIGMPCPVSENFRKECQDCGKKFWEKECFDHHKSSNQCQRSKQCDKCGTIWNVKVHRDNRGKQHVCGQKWCNNCLQFHSTERGCFIRPLEQKQQTTYRLVTFDFEATQHTKFNDSSSDRLHCVNFIAAAVVCTNCMLDRKHWKTFLRRDKKFCNICGPNRNITFSQRPFYKTKVDEQKVTTNPLHEFVNWLLFELDGRFTTSIFSLWRKI